MVGAKASLVAGFLVAAITTNEGVVVQYIYFGLIPFLLAGWFVYRETYKPADKSPDPVTSRDRRNNNFLYLLVFTAIYTWRFGLVAALACSVLVTIIRIVWVSAVRKQK